MATINIAQQDTLETVASNVNTINTNAARLTAARATKIDNIGATGDTGGSSTAGTLFGKLNKIISDITTFVGNWTATRAGYIDTIKSNTDRLTSARATIIDNIGATGNTGGSATAGTVMAKLNALLTSWTSTRAGYIDRLANSTYGLDKIKADTGSILSKVNSGVTASTNGDGILVKGGLYTTSGTNTLSQTLVNITGSGSLCWAIINGYLLGQTNYYGLLKVTIDGSVVYNIKVINNAGTTAYHGIALFVPSLLSNTSSGSTSHGWMYPIPGSVRKEWIYPFNTLGFFDKSSSVQTFNQKSNNGHYHALGMLTNPLKFNSSLKVEMIVSAGGNYEQWASVGYTID